MARRPSGPDQDPLNMPELKHALQAVDAEITMYTLANSDVTISMRDWREAWRFVISCYTQKLAQVVFGREVLARSTVDRPRPGKTLLDRIRLNAVVDEVYRKFPDATRHEIENAIKVKCRNEAERERQGHGPNLGGAEAALPIQDRAIPTENDEKNDQLHYPSSPSSSSTSSYFTAKTDFSQPPF